MDDESADILGQVTKPVLRAPKKNSWLGTSLSVKLTFGFAALLLLYVIGMRIWMRILVWKELSHKLAMRRRHGIPDNDHRPFNVAYAAVIRTRQEREAAQRTKTLPTQPLLTHDRRNAQPDQNIRQRFGAQLTSAAPRAASTTTYIPGAYSATPAPAKSPYYPGSPASNHVPSRLDARLENSNHQNGPYRRTSRIGLTPGEIGGQKRGFVEDPLEEEITKRSKWEDSSLNGTTRQAPVQPRRGAKRYLAEEDDDEKDQVERQPRDKRPRKVSLEKGVQDQVDSDMDVDAEEDEEDDDVDDLPVFGRGKKRDRAEAGSTFGGDDDETGSIVEDSNDENARRTRKRRTVSKRKSDADSANRGRKRDRDSGDEQEDSDDSDSAYLSRKKRGKKASSHDEDLSEDTPSRASSSSHNRKIGEEWLSNGIRWKIGPNGQKLRQALVRKARQKFPMPEDSQHPDRNLNFDVFVEAWLAEDEYQEAKTKRTLAWQDSPKRSEEPEKLAINVDQPRNVGKNLLWSSTSTPIGSPSTRSPVLDQAMVLSHRTQRDPFRSPMVSSGIRINPFDQLPAQNTRRISSISRSSSIGNVNTPSLADSTNSAPHSRFKIYSKFEKQELEAQALLKLRELKSKKEADQDKDKADKAEKDRLEKENVEKLNTAPTVPSITVTAPTGSSKPSLFGLGHPSTAAKPSEAPKQSLFGAPVIDSTSTSTSTPNATATPATGFMFAPANTTSSTTPAQPQNSLFKLTADKESSQASAPVTNDKTDATAKPPVSFSFPAPTSSSASVQASNTTQSDASKPLFGFGFSALKQATEQKAAENAPTTQPSTGSSLQSRLGPSSSTSTPATTTTTIPQSKPTFDFPSNTATHPFGGSSSQTNTPSTALATTTSTTTTTTPKFSFGFPNSGSITANNNSNTTSTNMTNGFAHPITTANPALTFNFKALTPISNSNNTNSSSSSATTPKVSFAVPSSTASSGSSNPFMTNNAGPSAFGYKPVENKPTETSSSAQPPKPLFSFGLTSVPTSSSSTCTSNGNTNNAVGVFNAGNNSTPNATSSSLFGALGNTSGNAGNTSMFGSNAGKTNTASAFGGSGLNTTSNNGTGSAFGGAGSGTMSSNGTASVFGGSAPSSNVFGNSNGNAGSTPVFGEAPKSVFGTASNNNMSTGKPKFLFSAPSGSNSTSAPKSTTAFGVTTTPLTNGTTSSNTSNSGTSGFTFNFGAPRSATSSAMPQSSPFGAAPGAQSAFANPGFTFGAPTSSAPMFGSSTFGSNTQQK